MAKAVRLVSGILAAVFIYGMVAAVQLDSAIQDGPSREHIMWPGDNRNF